MPLVKTIATLTHGRYLLAVPEGEGSFPLLVGCHGYAENAEKHLDALSDIPGAEGWVRCAVQGPSRFYHPRSQEVLASWMTRQDRELAIQDNIRYLADVVAEVRRDLPVSDVLVYAGFSQGVAMAWRAAALAGHRCRGVLQLAGDVPPELGQLDLSHVPSALIGRGTQDEWYDDKKLDQDVRLLEAKGVRVETCVFDGGHVWHDGFYRAAGEYLQQLSSL